MKSFMFQRMSYVSSSKEVHELDIKTDRGRLGTRLGELSVSIQRGKGCVHQLVPSSLFKCSVWFVWAGEGDTFRTLRPRGFRVT